jgi:hypothetical protein
MNIFLGVIFIKFYSMKGLLILLAISISSVSYGQVWGNSGATWHYEYGLFSGGLITMEYARDTTINNFSCQIIESTEQEVLPQQNGTTQLGSTSNFNYITRYSDDSVFWYSENQFHLLYDFGATAGDTWVIHESANPMFTCNSTSIVEVIDNGTIQINGLGLRYIDLRYVQGDFGVSGRAIERIGLVVQFNPEMSFLFPKSHNCDSTIFVDFDLYNFRCYEDDNFSVYNTQSTACDNLVATVGIEEAILNQYKEVLKVFDLLGREIALESISLNQSVIIVYTDGSTEKVLVVD